MPKPAILNNLRRHRKSRDAPQHKPKKVKTMGEKYGIKETGDLVIFLAAAVTAAMAAAKDGLTIGDLVVLVPLLDEGAKAFAGIDQVPKELSDLSAEEMTELSMLVTSRLTFTSGKVNAAIPATLSMLPGLLALIKALRAPATDPLPISVA